MSFLYHSRRGWPTAMHESDEDVFHGLMIEPPNEMILAGTRLDVICDATLELFPSPTLVEAVTQN